MYTDPDNMIFLSILMRKLYKNPELKTKITSIVISWINSSSTWRWQSALFLYASFNDPSEYKILEPHLKYKIQERLLYFNWVDILLISSLLKYYVHIRSLIVSVFNDSFRRTKNRTNRIELADIHVKFVKYCYYLVDKSYVRLPFVTCDSKEQLVALKPIISQVMSEYNIRKRMYFLLKQYLKELSRYSPDDQTIKYIAAYFQSIISIDEDYRADILYFLDNCQNTTSLRVRNLLIRVNTLRIGGTNHDQI